MKIKSIFSFSLTAFFLFGLSCHESAERPDGLKYACQLAEWDSLRLERLRSPDGWMNLAGLFWLKEGHNSIGSAGHNDIVFPRGPEEVGVVTMEGNSVLFIPSGETKVKAGGLEVSGSITMYGGERNAQLLTVDSLGFFIIRRGERLAVRLRDYVHPRLVKLREIDRYPPDQDWIIKARFIEPEEELFINVTDVLGEISTERVPGILEFEYGGKEWRLYPTGSGERLFIIFADDTNAVETYGGGRFIYTDGPDSKGYVTIDFNKAYNPPCAFTPYTTCPLPPRENILPFEVKAGEKAVVYRDQV